MRALRRLVWLIAAMLLEGLALWMVIPLTVILLAERGIDPVLIGGFSGVMGATMMGAALLAPALIARIGPRATLRGGIVLALGATVTFALTEQLVIWMLANGLLGVGLGLEWIVADSWVSHAAPSHRRGRIVGFYETLGSVTIGLGPLMLTLVGIGPHVPFVVGAGLLGIALLLTMRLDDPEALRLNRIGVADLRRIVAQEPSLPLLALLCGLLEAAATSVLPVYSVTREFSADTAALLVAAAGVGNLASQYPAGWLADRFGSPVVQRAFLAGLVIVFVLLPMGASLPALLISGTVLWGGMAGVLYTLAVVEAGAVLRGGELVGLVAVLAVAYTLGSMVGPVLGGAGISLWPAAGLFLTLGMCTVLVGATALVLRSRPSRRGGRQ